MKENKNKEWHSITKKNEDIIIEWSFETGMNLRVRKKGDNNWLYSQLKNSKYARSTAISLIREKK